MLDNILNHNLFLYIISATGVLGIAIRLVVNGYMKGLVRGAKNMEATRKRPLMDIRKKFGDMCVLDVHIADARSWVRTYTDRLKIGHVSVGLLSSFARSLITMALGVTVFSGLYNYYHGTGFNETLLNMMACTVTVTSMLVVERLTDYSIRKDILDSELSNYITNVAVKRYRKRDRTVDSVFVKTDEEACETIDMTEDDRVHQVDAKARAETDSNNVDREEVEKWKDKKASGTEINDELFEQLLSGIIG